MSRLSPQASPNGSRLVRRLNELAVVDVELSHQDFTERLGQLVDLTDSVNISEVHQRQLAEKFDQKTHSEESVTADFLQVRDSIVSSIVRSFGTATEIRRIKFPSPAAQVPADSASGFELYGRFYATHQQEMAGKIQQLQDRVRTVVSGASLELAQLASLDKVLGDTLTAHSRKSFATIPGLLRQHYDHLVEEFHQTTENPQLSSATWPEMLELFALQLRELLLAEVEARLLPAQGLIEALHSEIEKNPL